MRHLFTSLILTAGLVAAIPASAKTYKKFESDFKTSVSGVKVEVVIDEELAWRGENLPKDRRDRGSIRNFNDGFAGNGFYGDKDLARLAERLENRLAERLMKEGIEVNENASNVLRVKLIDAKPNRPTFRQLSKNPSLSFKSYGKGGASFEGELLSASGESNGSVSYGWYEYDIRDSYYGGTWSDARTAIDRFSKKVAKKLN